MSAEVDFPSYIHPNPAASHPHRVIISTLKAAVTFKYNSTRKLSFTRSQLPLIPAFAFTAHNAQGRSLDTACLDLESTRSTAAAYVMLSRLRSTAGLAILRPFDFKRISTHIMPDLRRELTRLDDLAAETKMTMQSELSWYYSLEI